MAHVLPLEEACKSPAAVYDLPPWHCGGRGATREDSSPSCRYAKRWSASTTHYARNTCRGFVQAIVALRPVCTSYSPSHRIDTFPGSLLSLKRRVFTRATMMQ